MPTQLPELPRPVRTWWQRWTLQWRDPNDLALYVSPESLRQFSGLLIGIKTMRPAKQATLLAELPDMPAPLYPGTRVLHYANFFEHSAEFCEWLSQYHIPYELWLRAEVSECLALVDLHEP